MARVAATTLRLSGLLIMCLGLIHLYATPHIPQLLDAMRSDQIYPLARAATLLNHVLVGFLLLPLGYTTWFASAPGNVSAPWARRILLINSIAMWSAPLSLIAFMNDPAYYRAPLFLVGAGLALLIPALMIAAVFALYRRRPPTGG